MKAIRLADLSGIRPALLMARWLALGAAAGVALALALETFGAPGPWQGMALLLALLTLFFISVHLIDQHARARQWNAHIRQIRRDERIVDALQREIQRHAQTEMELMQAKQAAESAAMAKGEFLATMSHEIRTPLNGIVPMLDLLVHASLPQAQKELLRTAYAASQQLLRIVDDILDYSKLEADRLVLESTHFNLREILDGVARMMERPAEAKGLRLHTQLDSNVRLPARGDPVRLRQVLTNLIGNAIKFTERGSITVSVRHVRESATQHLLRFEVRDTGIGIPHAAQARLFQAFSQADASTARLYGGTGLGLAICKRIVELMHGQIGVESQPEQGSVFWFEIPLLKVQGDLPAVEKTDPARRALLISNDHDLRMRLNILLPGWGLHLTSVDTTQAALDRLRNAADANRDDAAYGIVLADLQGMRSTAVALRRSLERHAIHGRIRLICLYGDDYVPEELQRNAQILPRQAPDPELRQALLHASTSAPPASPTTRPGADVPTLTAGSISLRHARVLLVEDNPVNLMVGQRLLGVLGVDCDTATNGEAALMRMSASRYDLVLMDCQMPIKDGYTATREWRENELSQNDGYRVAIVAMTANAMAGDRQKCLDAGMDDYLSKPVTRAELERCLHRWYKPRTAPAGDRPSNPCLTARPAPTAETAPPPSQPIPASLATVGQTAAQTAPQPPPEQTHMAAAPAITAAHGSSIDPHIIDELRTILGDDLDRLIRVFLQDGPELIAKLERAALRPDYPLLYQSAHALKSASANLGAMALSAAAKRIELGARSETLDRPAVAVALLAGEFERARAALQALLDAPRDASPSQPRPTTTLDDHGA